MPLSPALRQQLLDIFGERGLASFYEEQGIPYVDRTEDPRNLAEKAAGAVADIGLGIPRGVLRGAQGIAQAGELVGETIAEQFGRAPQDATTGFSRSFGTAAEAIPAGDPESFAAQVGEGLGSTVPILAGGAAAGAVKGLGRMTAATVTGMIQQAGSAYTEAKADGLDEDQARQYAGIMGLVGATEALPLERFLGASKVVQTSVAKGIIKNAVGEAKEEAVQEFIQGVLGTGAKENVRKGEFSLADFTDALADPDVWRQATVGAAAGGLLGGAVGGLQARAGQRQPSPAETAPTVETPTLEPEARPGTGGPETLPKLGERTSIADFGFAQQGSQPTPDANDEPISLTRMARRRNWESGASPNEPISVIDERWAPERIRETALSLPSRTGSPMPVGKAYHGTGAVFPAFANSKIGSGEGAIAKGWGMYFAGRKSTGEFYKKTVGKDKGVLYEVAIKPSADEMIDFDLPLSEQSAFVKAKLMGDESVINSIAEQWSESPKQSGWEPGDALAGVTGEDLLARLFHDESKGEFENSSNSNFSRDFEAAKRASQRLSELGIRGIRFKDGVAKKNKGDTNYNYVIFNDSDADVATISPKDSQPIVGIGAQPAAPETAPAVVPPPSPEAVADAKAEIERVRAEKARLAAEQAAKNRALLDQGLTKTPTPVSPEIVAPGASNAVAPTPQEGGPTNEKEVQGRQEVAPATVEGSTPRFPRRTSPPQVSSPMATGKTLSFNAEILDYAGKAKLGEKVLSGKEYILPGVEEFVFVLVPPSGSKAKGTKTGWTVWEPNTGKRVSHFNAGDPARGGAQDALGSVLSRLRNQPELRNRLEAGVPSPAQKPVEISRVDTATAEGAAPTAPLTAGQQRDTTAGGLFDDTLDDFVKSLGGTVESSPSAPRGDAMAPVPQQGLQVPQAPRQASAVPPPQAAPMRLVDMVSMFNDMGTGATKIVEQFESKKQGVVGLHNKGSISMRADAFIGPLLRKMTFPAKNASAQAAQVLALVQQNNPGKQFVMREKRKGRSVEVSIFEKDPSYAPQVFAHELGHAVDFTPNKTMKRGNILGHIAALRGYMLATLPYVPGLQKSVVEQELKALTQWWNPFTPGMNPKYDKYRFSAKELYAEALSVLFNNPVELQRRAPEFFRAWEAMLDQRPEARDAYNGALAAIAGGTNIENAEAERLAGYDRGRKAIATRLNKAAKGTAGVMTQLKRSQIDTAAYLAEVTDRLRRQGFKTDVAGFGSPDRAIEEARYAGGLEAQVAEAYEREVLAPVKAAGIDPNTLADYMFLQRALNERKTMANPGGIRAEDNTAQESLAKLQSRLTPQQVATLDAAANALHALRMRQVIPLMKASGSYSPELIAYAEQNPFYVKFDVLAYLEEKAAGGDSMPVAVAQLHRQIGTLAKIADPVTATLLQDLALVRGAENLRARRATVELYKTYFPNEIEEVQRVAGPGSQFKSPKEGRGLIYVQEDGKLKAYAVPEEIARDFERIDPHLDRIANVARGLTVWHKAFLTSFSLPFTAANVARDTSRFLTFMPGGPLMIPAKVASMVAAVPESVMNGIIRPMLGLDHSTHMKQMIADGLVIQLKEVGVTGDSGDQTAEIIGRYTGAKARSSLLARTFWAPFAALQAVARTAEINTKIAGDNYMKRWYATMPKEDRDHIVRTLAGSPAFLNRGVHTPLTNSLALFSNATLQGWRANIEATRARPWQVGANAAAMTVAPALLVAFMEAGVFEEMAKAMGADDDDWWVTFFRDMRRNLMLESDYNKTNYLVVPTGRTVENGRAINIKLPIDHNVGLLHAMTYRFAKEAAHAMIEDYGATAEAREEAKVLRRGMLATAAKSLGETAKRANPYQINPLIGAGWDVLEFAAGKAPYDDFRGRPAIDERTMTEGGWQANKAMLQYMFGQLGGSSLMRFTADTPDGVRSELEGFLGTPVLGPAFGRFISVTDRGASETADQVLQSLRAQQAKDSRLREEAAMAALNGEAMTAEQAEAYMNDPKAVERLANTTMARNAMERTIRILERGKSKVEKDTLAAIMPRVMFE